MPIERSAGAVIFRETKKGREYLLLQHTDEADKKTGKSKLGHWDFPKGHIEKGETTEKTVRREVKEETGVAKMQS
ncbi:MAG: ADP-ribose pyrophosphatase [Parcubacteria group bacterium Gr01-1014_33]|nr:MAG: ADP-ribose pyrophosphatase [Parcubacteria group bacterium Gr01-1014_33]